MYKMFFLVFIVSISCSDKSDNSNALDSASVVNQQKDSIPFKEAISNELPQSRIDTLNTQEKSFLHKLSKENESIIVSDKVLRYYTKDDSIPVVSKLILTNDFLTEKGYVYFELKFYGDISSVNLSYSYSRGQASFGYGSVTGNDLNDYLHTLRSCGLSNCITQVFQNGEKVFEKVN